MFSGPRKSYHPDAFHLPAVQKLVQVFTPYVSVLQKRARTVLLCVCV